jgi:hypothetical protein
LKYFLCNARLEMRSLSAWAGRIIALHYQDDLGGAPDSSGAQAGETP